MADKASRGMVVYGDGLARFINESHTHLHALASRAFFGFLSLPISPPSETEDARVVREFAQIIDAYESYHNTCGEDAVCLVPSISDRFMGMRSAIITKNSSLKKFGGKLGCTVLQLSDIIDDNHPNADLPIDVVASELLKLLGFQEGETSETKTESEISFRLHMSVAMSYGTVSEDDDTDFSFVCGDGNNSDLSLLFPCQSYMVKGWNLRNNFRYHSPMLLAQWQNAVTRKDVAETFSFKDFKEHGGILTIPADRFIHEIAFKLWKAPQIWSMR
ncbi:uncharacterized protein LOC130767279 isoform X3 [Actinidia eriantha]|uniref:uncharacterized protein LOC130767279 isoform X3 n=1 Tax=Actinidia eriantha TaxID=165200 RepID=UPI002582D6E8|nr:uncharacterized protein LOC130767279 isoform X3 [Actinidia eriantha]